ncbi:MAG: hypothetical protein H0T46_00480 [Deltaproteobacteria bacterium]|nr:hypothetical protein [Deltaproteobacteria bacterium]
MNRLVSLALLAACSSKAAPVVAPAPVTEPAPIATPAPAPSPEPARVEPPPAPRKHDAISRAELNRWAVRENIPLYWILDANNDHDMQPDEVASLLFYPSTGAYTANGRFTRDLETAYNRIVAAQKAPRPDATTPEGKRQILVGKDLDQGRATLVKSDLADLSADDKAFVRHMMKVGELIDDLYSLQNGSTGLADKLPADPASHSAFRRNRGPKCVGPATENDPACSAIPGSPKPVSDLYPAELQKEDKFCAALEKRPDAKVLMAPFVVVRGAPDALKAVPYTVAYQTQMTAIAKELNAAAASVKDPAEGPLVTYLRAAATSFTSNNWEPADEAWAKMTVDNSKWYVRVAPDEVYWEPCSSKAGLHLTFARINQGSKTWQSRLVPVQQEMEAAIANQAGKPYAARKVTFHLPDFIDIVINAGDDRGPLGATIGQSLPNWGPVANEGRGRTVAMVNYYQDPDSVAARRGQAESLLGRSGMKDFTGAFEPGLLSTILHEAVHNLGPAHEYMVGGKKAREVFGGPLATMMEELKAQTGAWFLTEFLRAKGIISDELAAQSYADMIVWSFGHISQGMYTGSGERKTYGNVAAINIGFLMDKGALIWDAKGTAANGTDKGAFIVNAKKIVPAVNEMMRVVGGIKARGDRKAAEALAKKYVDGKTVPHKVIQERFQRFPKASFVYSVRL